MLCYHNLFPTVPEKTRQNPPPFHGCISTAGPLSFGTVADVEREVREVRETLAVMMPGGGYCLAPTHAIQDNSPTENVVAMYDAAKTLGVY